MPESIERELWAMPLERRHMALRPLIGRPLGCRQKGASRCQCVVLASALRIHHREFPPGAQLPQDRFALDLPSRMEALPWTFVTTLIPRPLREVVFQTAMGKCLPDWATRLLPDVQTLRNIAYIINYADYEQ